jgi:mono/diheme cytochrome c family protein
MKGKWFIILLGVMVVLSLTLAACGGSSSASEPAGDAAAGQQTYASLPCIGCHGENAEGNVGPKLSGYSGGYDRFHSVVRNGEDSMPKFTTDDVSDQQLADIYAWVTSVK